MPDKLTADEIAAVRSMGLYWTEVERRDEPDRTAILRAELAMVVDRLGLKVLWVLLDYAEQQKAMKARGEGNAG